METSNATPADLDILVDRLVYRTRWQIKHGGRQPDAAWQEALKGLIVGPISGAVARRRLGLPPEA